MIPDQWYAILLSSKLRAGKKPTAIRRFGKDLALWRDGDGNAVCMPDACCHRKAKLSRGRIRDGCIECPYHGFRYNAEGRVTRIPAQPPEAKIPKGFSVTPWPLREHRGIVWVWYGPGLEPPTPLPPLPWDEALDAEFAAAPGRTVLSSDEIEASYVRLVENSTDLIHVAFVHRGYMPAWEQLEDLECTVDDVQVRLKGRVTNGTANHKGLGAEARFTLPATLLLKLGNNSRARFVATFSPIDDNRLWMCATYTQDYVRVPVVGRFLSWLLAFFDYRLLQIYQDAPIWRSQQPDDPSDIKDYRLIEADRGVSEIFKIRRRLLKEAAERRIRPCPSPGRGPRDSPSSPSRRVQPPA